MTKRKIIVKGIEIAIDKNGYISLTDIAKFGDNGRPVLIIQNWLRNNTTFYFLQTWEKVHNPDFKPSQWTNFKSHFIQHINQISPNIYIEQTESLGIKCVSKTDEIIYAHIDIALNFCYWFSPEFQVYFLKEFRKE